MSASFFILIDDIAAMVQNVSTMTKVSLKKTAGVAGDDLALGAEQVIGVRASRELHVVFSVAKGSLLNKAILLPLILLLNYLYPPLISLLLFVGGSYLCYEGVEAIIHKIFHRKAKKDEEEAHIKRVITLTPEELVKAESEKIKGAIKTDFILSGEILVISLGAMNELGKPFLHLSIGLVFLAILLTVLIYGLIALIVKADDFGLWLTTKKVKNLELIGKAILWIMPKFLKMLSIVGTVAMLLVGGAIVLHTMHFMHGIQEWVNSFTGFIGFFIGMLYEFIGGIITGLIVLVSVNVLTKVIPKKKINTESH